MSKLESWCHRQNILLLHGLRPMGTVEDEPLSDRFDSCINICVYYGQDYFWSRLVTPGEAKERYTRKLEKRKEYLEAYGYATLYNG